MCSGWSGAVRLALAAMLIALPASEGLAQTSLGGVDSSAPSQPPPPVVPAPAPSPRPASPRMDYIPPSLQSTPSPPPSDSTDAVLWAAIGFTADGSYYSAWKYASKAEAEAQVAKKCSAYGRGACEISAVSGRECIALAAFSGRRWKLSFTARGSTFPEAQTNALNYCNADQRTGGGCQFRTAVCADGR
jgi:hypothetical protein